MVEQPGAETLVITGQTLFLQITATCHKTSE
jgi:hypothetical protein